MTTCSFCGARNSEGETRCRKCGRKPEDTLNGEFSLLRTDGALATQLQPQHFESNTGEPQRAAIRGVQQQLFPAQSNVVSIAMYAPPRAEPKPQPRRSAPRRRPAPEGQTALDFLPPETPKPRTLSTTVEARITCEWPVAPAILRAIAGAIDCSLVGAAYGIFLGAYFACGGGFGWDRVSFAVFGAALALLGMSYGLMWTLAGGDTAGMRIIGLRVATFEGFPLDRRQRLVRFFAGCFSLCTIVGHLWRLVDEEGLAWHDHISRTFPTLRQMHAEVFRRI